MSAIRRWLARPLLSRGDVVFIAACVAGANGIQALAHLSDSWSLLVAPGLVITGYITWFLFRRRP